ncbi:MAG TPA: HNH endonuclease [Gemmatimonadota bacterium]|jgi:5-methylcytosine-specific restriction endonuclease McrA|nr:HNH endonuclease [Gemmatimonadota bacterium]
MSPLLQKKVLVLNQNYEPLAVCHAQRAIVMVVLGKAEIVERYEMDVRSVSRVVPLPSVVRLQVYIQTPRKRIALTRRNVLKRDGYRCQYCGTRRGPMTTDHIVPRALGGRDRWDNLVCACIRCNNRKGNRTPEQAGMSLARPPRAPHRYMQITFYTPIPDKRWRPYLFLD